MRRIALFALVLFVAACDSSSDPGGTFTADITGELAQSLEGRAEFERVEFFGEQTLFIRLIQGSFVVKGVTFVASDALIAGPGTYTINPENEEGVGFLFTDLSQAEFIRGGLGGTLTVTSLEDDRIVGTFEATIEPSDEPGSTTSEIEGRFDAEYRSTRPPEAPLAPEAEARLATR